MKTTWVRRTCEQNPKCQHFVTYTHIGSFPLKKSVIFTIPLNSMDSIEFNRCTRGIEKQLIFACYTLKFWHNNLKSVVITLTHFRDIKPFARIFRTKKKEEHICHFYQFGLGNYFLRTYPVRRNIWEENILIVWYKQWPIGLFSLIHLDSSHKYFLGTKPSKQFRKLNNKTLYTL